MPGCSSDRSRSRSEVPSNRLGARHHRAKCVLHVDDLILTRPPAVARYTLPPPSLSGLGARSAGRSVRTAPDGVDLRVEGMVGGVHVLQALVPTGERRI